MMDIPNYCIICWEPNYTLYDCATEIYSAQSLGQCINYLMMIGIVPPYEIKVQIVTRPSEARL